MEKNLCRVCGQDFYRVEMFDAHRADYKIVREHPAKECALLISKGLHPRGDCQVLVGDCIAPEDLGYDAVGTVWYDPKGLDTWKKMERARASRS